MRNGHLQVPRVGHSTDHQGGAARGPCIPPCWSSCPCPPDWAVYQLWQCHQAAGHGLWHHTWTGPGISGENQLLQLWCEEYLYHPQARGVGVGPLELFLKMPSKHQLPLSSKRPGEEREVAGPCLWIVPCLCACEGGVSPKRPLSRGCEVGKKTNAF